LHNVVFVTPALLNLTVNWITELSVVTSVALRSDILFDSGVSFEHVFLQVSSSGVVNRTLALEHTCVFVFSGL